MSVVGQQTSDVLSRNGTVLSVLYCSLFLSVFKMASKYPKQQNELISVDDIGGDGPVLESPRTRTPSMHTCGGPGDKIQDQDLVFVLFKTLF